MDTFMDSLFSLQNKTILIVGASSGIGHHAAHLFAKWGGNLILAARREPLIKDLSKKLGSQSIAVDITKPETIADLLSQIKQVDVLLNTAGLNIRKPALAHTEADWDTLMNTNLKGAWALTKAVIQKMINDKTSGKIINMSSIYGTVTAQDYLLYATSKAGIEHMTRSFALENGKYGIQVNAIAPGYIETDLNREYLKNVLGNAIAERTPLGRLAQLQDLNGALLLLASQASDYITGTIISVDGGCAARRFL
jgi:hypothetical protein